MLHVSTITLTPSEGARIIVDSTLCPHRSPSWQNCSWVVTATFPEHRYLIKYQLSDREVGVMMVTTECGIYEGCNSFQFCMPLVLLAPLQTQEMSKADQYLMVNFETPQYKLMPHQLRDF